MTTTTVLLQHAESADAPSLERVVALIYDELRRMARGQLAGEYGQLTLQTTELVHEAYLKLVDDGRVTRRGRAYFFGAAARAMRQVLIEAARRRTAGKRGGGAAPITLEEQELAVDTHAAELVELDAALQELETRNPRQVRVVECRYFAGLTVEETATALDVSPRTVKSDWALARAWLYEQLREPNG